jgi:hypothetical protein
VWTSVRRASRGGLKFIKVRCISAKDLDDWLAGRLPDCRAQIPNGQHRFNRTGSIYWFAIHAESRGISWMTNMRLHGQGLLEEERDPIWFNAVALLISVAAGVTAFLPIALYTSPWDAVRLRVPGDQGNWWHLLVGAPYFLAFPMIWLRLRALFSRVLSTPAGRRLIWAVVALSICGTVSVTLPFLLRLGNLAHMSECRRLAILGPTFGILIASGALLFLSRRSILPTRAALAGLNTAYLANAALCLVVYGPMPGTAPSRYGWTVTMVIVWPMLLELVWIFIPRQKALK